MRIESAIREVFVNLLVQHLGTLEVTAERLFNDHAHQLPSLGSSKIRPFLMFDGLGIESGRPER